MRRQPFIWQEVEHWVGQDLMDTLSLISDQEEADSFIEAYAAECDDDEHALQNVRYMLQILASRGEVDTKEIAEWFGVEHPEPSETIQPRQWWRNSSLGIKEKAA